MCRQPKFRFLVVTVLLAPAASLAVELEGETVMVTVTETVALMDLRADIRCDILLYVRQNIDAVSDHESPTLVQRRTTLDSLQIRLEYQGPAAEKENDPAIEVICTYRDTGPNQCSHRFKPPGRYGPLDPPLPELQRPIINDSGI